MTRIRNWFERSLIAAVLLALLLAAPATLVAQPQAAPAAPAADEAAAARAAANERFFDEIATKLGQRFFDRSKLAAEWPAIRARHLDAVRATTTTAELYDAINTALGELKVSHLSIYDKYVYETWIAAEMRSSGALRPGFGLIKVDGKLFCVDINEKGCAARAGLKLGDELLEVNGRAVAGHPDVLDAGSDYGIAQERQFVVRVRDGEQLVLTVRREAGAEPQTITITPERSSYVADTRDSVKVIEQDGKKIGYLHAHNFLSGAITQIVYDAIRGPLATCDGLMLDIRGHGGSPQVIQQILACFRDNSGRAPKWNKPLVVLVDGHTRSAKEIFAHAVRSENLGVLVGTRTTGAVLGSQFIPLSDGSQLLCPMVDGRRFSRDGAVLEGNGVKPHFPISPAEASVAYANGRDGVIEAGKNVMRTLLKDDTEMR